jgi:hypothetical protein
MGSLRGSSRSSRSRGRCRSRRRAAAVALGVFRLLAAFARHFRPHEPLVFGGLSIAPRELALAADLELAHAAQRPGGGALRRRGLPPLPARLALVGAVELPTANARAFVDQKRRLLESEAVSRGLHFWLDLIFGGRSRGHRALAAKNIFPPLCYPETVPADADAIAGEAAAVSMASFGQCPLQILSRAHPPRARFPAARGLEHARVVRPRADALIFPARAVFADGAAVWSSSVAACAQLYGPMVAVVRDG